MNDDLSHLLKTTPASNDTPHQVAETLLTVIEEAITRHPRSLQVKAGPSDLGSPCSRKLGHLLAKTPKHNHAVGWLPAIGTAMHDQLDVWFAEHNEKITAENGHLRWLLGAFFTLPIAPIGGEDITGHGDMYDLATGTVIDWKIVGKGTLDKARKNRDPGQKYRTQAHCYGKGWNARGLQTQHVAVMFLPRNSISLRDAYYWSEPYDPSIADAAITRAQGIATAIAALGPDAVIPQLTTADDYCSGCPWYRAGATDLTRECPGSSGQVASAGRAFDRAVDGLIAPAA